MHFEFYFRYLFISIHYNIIPDLQKKVEQIKQYFFIAENYTNGLNTIIQRKSAYLKNTKDQKNKIKLESNNALTEEKNKLDNVMKTVRQVKIKTY